LQNNGVHHVFKNAAYSFWVRLRLHRINHGHHALLARQLWHLYAGNAGA
jgi:hypothetical protein